MREPDFLKAKRLIWEATAWETIGIKEFKYEESEDDIKDREWLEKYIADNEEDESLTTEASPIKESQR